MSSNTWTPEGLSSNSRPIAGKCWRIVEAQHVISTAKVTDTLEEQRIVEDLIEESKPSVPPECRELDYLLSTPFRYLPYPFGSRFRRPGDPRGVFYGAETPETAAAEVAFYRLLFFAESPRTPWPANAGQFTAFAAEIGTQAGLDLSTSPLNSDAHLWTLLADYSHCRDLADAARDGGIDVIRYLSVRDPNGGTNLAVLRCRAFASNNPLSMQTWHIHLGSNGVRAVCEFPRKEVSFGRDVFAADPRMSGFQWERETSGLRNPLR